MRQKRKRKRKASFQFSYNKITKKRNHISKMKKGTKGEVVLSAYQIQATRLNRLEYRRLQININSLHNDLQNHLSQLNRQEHGLRYHFTHVVRVVKPNREYQLWKQAHAHEIAQEEAKDLIGLICLY
jgi:hypothetical protein